MPESFDPPIAYCPNPSCNQPIWVSHPYTWCKDCGQALPEQITSRLFHLPGARTNILPGTTRPLESMSTDEKIAHLIERLQIVESRLPNSDIISHSFWRRAWTVFGYSIVTTLVIYAGLLVIFLFIALLGSLAR